MSFLSEARVKSIVKMKSAANLRKIRSISRTHQSVSYTWVETEAVNWINTRFEANLSRLSRFFSHDRVERSWQAPSRSLKHDNVAIWLIVWANNSFMNALALHLNNAFYCARKKTPRHDMNSRNPLIAGITRRGTFRDNLHVSLVTALNKPRKSWNDENICEMACLIADVEDNRWWLNSVIVSVVKINHKRFVRFIVRK